MRVGRPFNQGKLEVKFLAPHTIAIHRSNDGFAVFIDDADLVPSAVHFMSLTTDLLRLLIISSNHIP